MIPLKPAIYPTFVFLILLFSFNSIPGLAGTGASSDKAGELTKDAFMPLFIITAGPEDNQVAFNMDGTKIMPGYLQGPAAGAADSSRNIYITDTLNNRVIKYSRSGKILKKFDLKKICMPEKGSKNKSLEHTPLPIDIVINKEGMLMVADAANNRVHILDSEGRLLNTIGKDGTGPEEFRQINKIHCDSKRYVFIEDVSSTRTSCFDLEGNFMLSYKGMINIAVDPWGNLYQPLYLNDNFSRSVAVYDTNGNLVENKIKMTLDHAIQYVTMPGIDSQGHVCICCDTADARYYAVKDENNRTIEKYKVLKKSEGYAMIRPEWISPHGDIYTARYRMGKLIIYRLEKIKTPDKK